MKNLFVSFLTFFFLSAINPVHAQALTDQQISAIVETVKALNAEPQKQTTETTDKQSNAKAYQEWSDVIANSIVESARKVGVATNEFVQSPTGIVVTAIIVYKVIGKDILRILFAGMLSIVAIIASIVVWNKRERVIQKPTKYETVPVLFGLWTRRIVTQTENYRVGDDEHLLFLIVIFFAWIIPTTATLFA